MEPDRRTLSEKLQKSSEPQSSTTSLPGTYDTCFFEDDSGQIKNLPFFHYIYSEFEPKGLNMGEILRIRYSAYNVIIEGRNLDKLQEALVDKRIKRVSRTDKRYIDTVDPAKFIATSINVTQVGDHAFAK